MNISMSDIGSFSHCRRSWDWGMRQNLMPHVESPALLLGSGIHYALEHWYRNDARSLTALFGDWYRAEREAHDGEPPIPDAQLELGLHMCNSYMAEYGKRPSDDPHILRTLTTEQEFYAPIPGTGGTLIGTLDGLIEDRNGQYWAIDHKTYSQAWNSALLTLNQQFLGYTWATQWMSDMGVLEERFGVPKGTRIQGVLFNGLRKQKPSPNVRAPLFQREWVTRSRTELLIFEEHLRIVYSEIARAVAEPEAAVYPAPGNECGWCAFQAPCIAKQTGEDWEWMLRALYTQRPHRGTVYAPDFRPVAGGTDAADGRGSIPAPHEADSQGPRDAAEVSSPDSSASGTFFD